MTGQQASRGDMPVRRERVVCSVALFGLLLGAAAVARAGTLSGSVENGTSHRAVSGAEVVLMKLDEGMTPVDKVKTDWHGRFRFRNVDLAKESMLLEVSNQGVPYYRTISSGEKTASIVVYDTTADRESIVVISRAVMFKPDNANLQVEEEYIIENQSQPAVSFYTQGGTFAFPVPENARLGQVFAWAVNNIATRQGTIDLASDRKAINWPFRPGKSVVRIFYAVPYGANQATLRSQSPYETTHVFLVVPPGVHVSSDGFSPVGSEHGLDLYARQSVPADVPLAISVSGVSAALPAANAGDQPASSEEAAVSTLPGRYHKVVWIGGGTVGVLLLVATLFFWYGSAARAKLPAAPIGKREGRPIEPVDLEQNLNRLREEFLELKRGHQGGKISEEEYTRERERAEQILREILRD